MFTDDSDVTHDLTQMLAADGTPLVDFSHEGQGPVPEVMRTAAMNRCVEDHER